MSQGALTPFEASIREALAFAQQRRKSQGLPPADHAPRKKRDGSRVVGPDKYKLTLFLQPWHYADLIHFKQNKNISYGLNKIIEQLIEDNIQHVAARPERVKTAAQISTKSRNKVNISPIRRPSRPSAYQQALRALPKTG